LTADLFVQHFWTEPPAQFRGFHAKTLPFLYGAGNKAPTPGSIAQGDGGVVIMSHLATKASNAANNNNPMMEIA